MKGYDALDSLFFRVLAKKTKERDPAVTKLFDKVPYLNSSLFEPTELERETIFISNLQDDCMIPCHPGTVLKNNTGKRLTGTLNGLDYLFAFLDAYDFSGEGAEEIQEDNKTLINSSVLGLIFEKINGYKDGSFFTPGFITMYMCRETIRRAVVQKFNDLKGWNCQNLEELYDKIEDKKEANDIINSLKICDPGVGSGHFLVSALNEIIAIKSELKILSDKDGKRLKEYHVEVANDELIITDEDAVLFEYNPNSPESQRVQETIFYEKQTIIENCLFGVDINPNSIKICRLRLWIELLKNAYYLTPQPPPPGGEGELQTLPNIDINIKCGNSLISRYSLDADIKQALKKSKWSIDSYRLAVMTYRNAQSKEEKRTMERLIESIKTDFETEVAANDKRLLQLKKLNGDLFNLTQQTSLFERSKKELEEWNKRIQHLGSSIQHLELELESIKSNKIYENAFEWRFEFPEVLNDEGDFVGFDIVIGNPPYGIKVKGKNYLDFVNQYYSIARKVPDSYFLFMIKGIELLRNEGELTFIVPNTFCDIEQGDEFRRWFLFENNFYKLYNSSWVFADAIVDTIVYFQSKSNEHSKEVSIIDNDFVEKKLIKELFCRNRKFKIDFRSDRSGKILLQQIEDKSKTLKTIAEIRAGVKLYEKGKGNPPQDENVLQQKPYTKINEQPNGWRPLIRGGDIERYSLKLVNEFVRYGEWLAAPRDNSLFLGPRIIMRRTDDVLRSTIINDDSILVNSCHIIKLTTDLSPYVILAQLNSKLIQWVFKMSNPQMVGKVFAEIKVVYVEELPIRLLEKEQELKMIKLVDQILVAKKSDPTTDTTALEKEIDQLVYKLYGLTEEEIRIIEQSF
jgi:predicted RNA methylase